MHQVLVPGREDSLSVLMRRVHGRYAQYYNARWGRTGHLWQNRFFSCILGIEHLWPALAYVERNPVRAGMVKDATDYPWSSAAAHVSSVDTTNLLDMVGWSKEGPKNWKEELKVEQVETEAQLRHVPTLADHSGQNRSSLRSAKSSGEPGYAEDRKEGATGGVSNRRKGGSVQSLLNELLKREIGQIRLSPFSSRPNCSIRHLCLQRWIDNHQAKRSMRQTRPFHRNKREVEYKPWRCKLISGFVRANQSVVAIHTSTRVQGAAIKQLKAKRASGAKLIGVGARIAFRLVSMIPIEI